MPHSPAAFNCTAESPYLFLVDKLSFNKLKVNSPKLLSQGYRRFSHGAFAGGGTFTKLKQKCPIVRGCGGQETYA